MHCSEAELARYLERKSPNAVLPRARARTAQNCLRFEPSETQIHEAVADHLRTRSRLGVHWHHPATGELRDPGTARKLQRMGVKPGLPDFLLLIDGRLHGLELKRDRGGRVSSDQKAMHHELIAAGAIIAVARGIDEALTILNEWGAFGPASEKGSMQ